MKIHRICPKNRNLKDIKRVKNKKSAAPLPPLYDFSKPIYISEENMKNYAKQIKGQIARWKRIFGI